MDASSYVSRYYRDWQHPERLVPHVVRCGETDLHVSVREGLSRRSVRSTLLSLVLKYRAQIEETIEKCPAFRTSLLPLEVDSEYPMIRRMSETSRRAGVGPMAGVAGAVAEWVGLDMLALSDEIIVENGGDVFIKSGRDRTVLVYPGEGSPFGKGVRIRLRGSPRPVGLATSSAKVGHSLSLGDTDATLIVADSATAADVFATAVGNRVKGEADLPGAMEFARSFEEIRGGLVILGGKLGAFGEIEFV